MSRDTTAWSMPYRGLKLDSPSKFVVWMYVEFPGALDATITMSAGQGESEGISITSPTATSAQRVSTHLPSRLMRVV